MRFKVLYFLAFFILLYRPTALAIGDSEATPVPPSALSSGAAHVLEGLSKRISNRARLPYSNSISVAGRTAYFLDRAPFETLATRDLDTGMCLYSVDLDSTDLAVRMLARVPRRGESGYVCSAGYSSATESYVAIVLQPPVSGKPRHPLADPEALESSFKLVNLKTGAVTVLEDTGNSIHANGISFSRNGKLIAFYASVPGGKPADMGNTVAKKILERGLPWSYIRILNLETGVSRQISPGIPGMMHGPKPGWSPNSRFLAVSLALPDTSGTLSSRVRIFDAAAGGMETLPTIAGAASYGSVEWLDEETLLIAADGKIGKYGIKSGVWTLLADQLYFVGFERAPSDNIFLVTGYFVEGAQAGQGKVLVLDPNNARVLREDPLDAAAPGSPWAYPAFK